MTLIYTHSWIEGTTARRRLSLFLFLMLATPSYGGTFSSFDFSRSFETDGSRGPYPLSDRAIVLDSDSLCVGGRLARRGDDYWIDFARGTVTFLWPLPPGTLVLFQGKRQPEALRPRVYGRRSPEEVGAKLVTTRLGSRRSTRVSRDRAPATGIRIGGVKRLQVEMGSSSTVTQSLRLELNGEVSDGVRLQALLTDRNLPLQSAGQTRGIDELERVFFRLQAPGASAGVGDLEVGFNETTFGRYRRQLRGVQVSARKDGHALEVFGAVARGRRFHRRIAVVHGFQGPYHVGAQITGGSERVYVDGRRLHRGEGQDYVIDYDRGTVTFTAAEPIGGESQVTIEGQSYDPQDRGRLVGFRGATAFSSIGRVGATYLREDGAGLTAGQTTPAGPRQLVALDGSGAIGLLRFNGEVGMSRAAAADSNGTSGRALKLRLSTDAVYVGRGSLRAGARYQDIGDRFEPFDRVMAVTDEGRWGWQPESTLLHGRMGEVEATYRDRTGVGVEVGAGRRTGKFAARRTYGVAILDRRDASAEARVERLSAGDGHLSTQSLSAEKRRGWVRPSALLRFERAKGSSVASSSLFYALPSGRLPDGVRRRDGRLSVAMGSSRHVLTSTVAFNEIDQLTDSWRDSASTVSTHHRIETGTSWGLSTMGEMGRSWRRSRVRGTSTSDVGRVRVGFAPRNGFLSHQMSYRIATTGVDGSDAQFVFVGEGRGTFIWEDVDGDGEEDAEEFIYEEGGDYDPAPYLSPIDGPLRAVRDATLGTRVTLDPSRLLSSTSGRLQRLISAVAYEGSLEANRQMSGQGGLAPWSLGTYQDDVDVWAARREIRTTVHVLRRKRGVSFRFDDRRGERLDRSLSEDGRTSRRSQRLEGRFRFGRRFDLETLAEGEQRSRAGMGPFAHDVASQTLQVRGLLRHTSGWQTGLSWAVGVDTEANRGIEAGILSIAPEVRKPIAGKGRFSGRLGWTRVRSDDSLPLFLGLADGNRRGNNLDWRFGLDYRLSSYLTAFASYDGRVRPDRPLLHFGRMEMRASF